MSFDNLVEEVRTMVFDAIANQDLALAAIQHGAYRRASVAPSQQLHLTLEMLDPSLGWPFQMSAALTAVRVSVPYNRTTVPNVVRLTIEPASELSVRCTFQRGRVSQPGVRALLWQFRALLVDRLADPREPLGAFYAGRSGSLRGRSN
jgi:hypothetical protein